jgi:uncharacterized protein
MIKKALRIALKIVLVLFMLLNISAAFHAHKFTHFYDPAEVKLIPQSQKSGWQKIKEAFVGAKYVKRPNQAPDSFYTEVILKTSDGLKLKGWYASIDSSVGTVLLFHGHGGNRSGVLREAREFRDLGYNTLLMDFRAHGDSEGNTCTIGYEEVEDVKLAYDFVKMKGEDNIVMWGISLGAATITRAIYKHNMTPAYVILELPYASILDAVKSRVKMMGMPTQPISTLLTFWGGVENGFWAFNLEPAEYVKSITCPVLLQFGTLDNRVSIDEANRIAANITTPKQVVFYEHSGHESLCKSENKKWTSTVASFLRGN